MNKPIGVDVSYYEVMWGQPLTGEYWKPEKAIKPIDFVIQRSSYGITKDKCFDFLYEKSTKQIPIIGFYHYFSSWFNYKTQMDVMLKAIEGKNYSFLAVDYEGYGNTLNERTFAEMCEMVKQLKVVTGKKVLTYFNPNIYKSYMKPYGADNVIKTWDVWLAEYPVMNNWDKYIFPEIYSGVNVIFHQAGGGDVPQTIGIISGLEYGSWRKGIDLNVWHGTKDELYAWAGITNPIPNPDLNPKPKPITYNYYVTTASLNVRSTAGISGGKIGTFLKGSGFNVIEYLRIGTEIWAKIMNGWICLLQNGINYTTKTDYSDVPSVHVPVNLPKTLFALNVRIGPGTTYGISGIIPVGSSVNILEQVRGVGDSIWGKLPIGKYICLFMNGVYYTTLRTFTVPPKEVAGLYLILSDGKAGIEPNGTRPYYREGLPCTVPIQGGDNTFRVPDVWLNYLRQIMSPNTFDYVFKPASGWQNGKTPYVVRELTFGGNIVEVIDIVDNKAYIKCLTTNSVPPTQLIKPKENSLNHLIQMFSTQYIKDDRLDMSTDERYPYTLLMVDNKPTTKPWIDVRNLKKI